MKIPKTGDLPGYGLRRDPSKFMRFETLLLVSAWLLAGCAGSEGEPAPAPSPPAASAPAVPGDAPQIKGGVGAEPKVEEKKAEEPKDDPKAAIRINPPKPAIDASKTIVSNVDAQESKVKSLDEPAKETEKPKEKDTPRKVENERIRANDEVLRTLETANIAFNAPDSMNIEDTARIQLLLSLEKSVAELKSQIEAAGKVEGETIRVSDRMIAELKGPDFEITVITPVEQAIATAGEVEWRWDVKPKSAGRLQLNLTLTAILSIQGRDTQRLSKTLDKFIEIEVTPAQKIVGFFEKAWQWIWAAILVPIFGWLWTEWKSKTTRTPEAPNQK